MAAKDRSTTDGDNDIVECSGFLKKKGRHSPKWSLVFAKVIPCVVKYGPSEQSLLKSIDLAGAVIEDWEEKGSPNIFSIAPREGRRKYIFSTDDAEEHQRWLQAVCLAKLSQQTSHEKSEACIIQ